MSLFDSLHSLIFLEQFIPQHVYLSTAIGNAILNGNTNWDGHSDDRQHTIEYLIKLW